MEPEPGQWDGYTILSAVVLYDTDEIITAKIENFKDGPAVLTMIQHIPGQWDMEELEDGTIQLEVVVRSYRTPRSRIGRPYLTSPICRNGESSVARSGFPWG